MKVKPLKKKSGFEKAFSSMWKTAKSRRITKKDITEEINKYRKESD